MTFSDNLKTLSSVETLDRIELHDANGSLVATIENKPGQQGSLAVYHHLLQRYGAIDAPAAREGLALYAEHTEDARRSPGKHPNIDRLLAILSGGAGLSGKIISRL